MYCLLLFFFLLTVYFENFTNSVVRRFFRNLSGADSYRIRMTSRRNFVIDPSRSFAAVWSPSAFTGFHETLHDCATKKKPLCRRRDFLDGSRARVPFPRRHDVTTHRAEVIFLCMLQLKPAVSRKRASWKFVCYEWRGDCTCSALRYIA